jgi:Histidine kinase-, DNA gyrase B-, and HSP90-like ATPase
MTSSGLLSAMQFGSERNRSSKELGKFGMGLKTAAFSQGRSLTVVSKKGGQTSACRWTTKTIASGWKCEILDSQKAGTWITGIHQPFSLNGSGTLVVIDELDHIRAGSKGLEATLQTLQKKLSVHLGLTFHRFLDSGIRLYIDASPLNGVDTGFSVSVDSLNPFSYPISGDKNYPLAFSVKIHDLPSLECTAHIWPPNQNTSGYLLSGGNVVRRQGFYFYRNERLIQAGGWNGWKENDSEHHLSLARVAVELPPQFDAEFRLNVQKSGLDVPETFRTALSEDSSPMGRYVKRAEEVYRKTHTLEYGFVPVPGRGFGGAIRRRSASYLAGVKAPKHEINVLWNNLEPDQFFSIDRLAGNIVLNAKYRGSILSGSRASLNDAPLVKILIFLVLRDDLLRERESKRFTARLDEINELIMLAIREVE